MRLGKNIVIRMILFLFVFAFIFGLFVNLFHVKGIYMTLISGSFYYICLIAMLVYTLKGVEKKSLESIGFNLHSIWKKVIIGIGIFGILGVIFTSFYFVIFGRKPYFVHLSFTQTLLNAIYYICLVGFAEEFIFRGYLLQRFNEILNSKLYAILLSSVLFALWHYPVRYYWGQVLFAFFFGIILSTIRVKTKGNILISLAIGHGLYNAFPYIVGYFIK